MIKSILISNFKLYKDNVKLPLSSLNLFTGTNGRGKSTALQVFLLLSQSVLINRATNKIYLNGDNVRLGSFGDIKNKEVSISEQVHFGFEFDQFSVDYFLHHTNSDASELFIEKIIAGCNNLEIILNKKGDWYSSTLISEDGQKNEEFQYPLFDLFLGESSIERYPEMINLTTIKNGINLTSVHYVSADRIGPHNYYENNSLSQFVSVGAFGENTVNILHHKGNDKVNKVILDGYCKMFGENIDELSQTIEDNTNNWIDKIFQGAKIQVEPIKGEDLLKLRINSDGRGSYFKPTNVGYGFSYSLPIIVAGLIAKPGEILIIENPEAHLHPYAQSIIAKFLSLVSVSGVQVLIETHSEHILNGLRVAAKDKIIKASAINLLYFDNRNTDLFSKIKVDDEGGVSDWPIDFFDQATKDLNYLLDI